MSRLSLTAQRVQRSGVREIVNLAMGRPDVVRLEIGEPNFPTPAHIVDAAARSAATWSGYVQSAGTPQLRQAAAESLARRHGLDIPPDRIVVCQGAAQGLAAVLSATVSAGDEVLVPDPAWPNYEMQAVLLGATVARYTLDAASGFQPDLEQIAQLIGPRTKVLVLNSPSNPTGTCLAPHMVAAIVALAGKRGVLVVSDEVYDEILFEGTAANAIREDPGNVVGVYSLSKTYAMTGWRIGYLALPPWLAGKVAQMQEPLLSSVSSVTQAAGVAALTGPQECVSTMRESYRARRDSTLQLLAAGGLHPVLPTAAFYLMVPLSAGVDSRAAALSLLDAGVATAPGTAFGVAAAHQLRLSLASSADDLRTGVDRLLNWFDRTAGGAELDAAASLSARS